MVFSRSAFFLSKLHSLSIDLRLRSNDKSAPLRWNRAYIAGMPFGEIGWQSKDTGWRWHLAEDIGQSVNRPGCVSRNVVAWKNYSIMPSSQSGQSSGNGPDMSRDFFVQLWVVSKKRLQSVETNRKKRLSSSEAPVVGEKPNGYVTTVLNQPPTSQSMSGPLKPSSPEEARIAPLVARSTLLITRDIEWANLVVGFEQENRYNIVDRCYPASPVGFIREHSNVIARQLLRSRRPFIAHILDALGNELFRVRRPFWWINSTIYVEVDGKEIGVVHRRWHLWRRIYDLYLGNKQFAEVVNPGFWHWTFTLKGLDDEVLAQIDRNWRGFGFQLFTDAGQYVIAFGSAEPSSVPLAGVQELQVKRPLTISERAVAIALAVSLDNDYFSVHGGWHLPFYLAE